MASDKTSTQTMNQSIMDITENDAEFSPFRDGNLFVLDATPEMFEINPETEMSYFAECLKVYGDILSGKLSFNRRDWMGLILFGTSKWDVDPIETKHILTLEKFGEINIAMFKSVMNIFDNELDCYKKLASQTDYPLHDVLWHAARFFDSVKVSMQLRQVVLLTCRDNPLSQDKAEQHRIRTRAKTFSDINVKLQVVGLGENWNHNLFYKDVEMLANSLEDEDIKSTKLESLVQQVKFPSRVSGHLTLKIGQEIEVATVISPFSSETSFLKKAQMSKTTNEILDKHIHWGKPRSFDEDLEDEESQEPVKTDAPTNIRRLYQFGNKKIIFTPEEYKKILSPQAAGIEVLGFKPISQDLAYFISAPKFVGIDPNATPEETKLFAALLKKCEEKGVMATCVVSLRSGSFLANLIPNIRHSGFTLNKIPFQEQMENIQKDVAPYVYKAGELPVDAEGVALMKKLAKKLYLQSCAFENPELEAQLAYLETLALDTTHVKPEDRMLLHKETVQEQLGNLPKKFEIVFPKSDEDQGETSKSKSRQTGKQSEVTKIDCSVVEAAYKNGTLESTTYVNLKAYAKVLGISASGKKAQIIDRIIEYYEQN